MHDHVIGFIAGSKNEPGRLVYVWEANLPDVIKFKFCPGCGYSIELCKEEYKFRYRMLFVSNQRRYTGT